MSLPTVPVEARRNEIALFLGAKGTGKSTRILAELRKRDPRETVLLWDPEGWFPETIAGRRFSSYGHPSEFVEDNRRGAPPYRVRFVGCSTDTAHLLVSIAWLVPGTLIVFDDAANLTPHGVGKEWLRVAITTARHRAVSLWFASQSPTLLDKTAIRNADRAIVGRLGYVRDRKALFEEFEDPRTLTLDKVRPGRFLEFHR